MRQLTKQQKKLLDQVIRDNPETMRVEDLENEIWERLVSMNDTEILWQEVNRYLSDAYFSNQNRGIV